MEGHNIRVASGHDCSDSDMVVCMWDELLTVGQRIKEKRKKRIKDKGKNTQHFTYSMEAFTKKKTCLDIHHCFSESHITHKWDQHLRVFSSSEGVCVLRESSVAFCPAINSEVTCQHPSWLSGSIWGPWGAFPPSLGTQCPHPAHSRPEHGSPAEQPSALLVLPEGPGAQREFTALVVPSGWMSMP